MKKLQLTGPGFAAGLGAGLAAALLWMLVAKKTSLALAMGFISPLPIMIAAMGFGSLSSLIACLVGAVAVGLFDIRPDGLVFIAPSKLTHSAWLDVLVFALTLAVPSAVLGRLAGLPVAPPNGSTIPKMRPDELRLGRCLAVAVGFSAVGVLLEFGLEINKLGGFAAFLTQTVAKAEPIVQSLLDTGRSLPQGITIHDVARAVTWAQMPIGSAAGVVLLVFNLWLAGRIALTSGLLASAWPDIPRCTRMPRPLALLLAVALGLSFAGGLIGMASLIVSGALLMSFAMQGLAVIHATTRGKSFRLPALIILYLLMAMLLPWLIVCLGLLGLIDSAFALRDRPTKAKRYPGPWQPPRSKT